ncbi:hypothetical protein K432DRAFT_429013 [Lepidopterella palustris CBS 459.81]|uniref:Uncharacterized protein n=1 Tax=Lepidopterella palustris CBS 459.81 TaxID=1314670 RepID=A0A8E2JB88_9PEZI|nr:hypothetical protein K432DRAFT_429013 [Lepidopterella palustris CBS 459.81]
MATDLIAALLPLVTDDTAKLVKEEAELVHKQNPALAPFELVENTLEALISDPKFSESVKQELRNLELANVIAKISNVNVPLMTAAFQSPLANNLREFAQKFDTSAIQNVVGDQAKQLAQAVRTEVFNAQPTATVQGMLEKDKIALSTSDPAVKADVISVLSRLNDTFISDSPMSTLTTIAPDAVKDVPPERLPAVTHELNTLSRMQAISPTTTMMEHLASTGITSALAAAQFPKSSFVNSVVEKSAGAVSPAVAASSHDTATAIVRRNENMLMDVLLKGRGTGLKAIDGENIDRKLQIQAQIRKQGLDLNIENLFGSNDQCICDECMTVYSAASYLVDLLVYLRNNNLSPALNPNTSSSGQSDDISGTVLEKLFRRRPDLGNLELTCENTNTILPYIDLANEVMESFIVNLDSYNNGPVPNTSTFPQAEIDAFNVSEFQDSAELLSQPQNVNYDAYRTLASSVYPFTLPYHLPISTIRIFLQYLKVSRGDLLDAVRRKLPVVNPSSNHTVDPISKKLRDLQKTALDRQISAEYVGLIQEEYIALTKEAFFTDEWFNVTEGIDPKLSGDDYRSRIGVRDVWTYWGYPDIESMMDTSGDLIDGSQGLCFVKNQVLTRSGVSWVDLTQIVQTSFINPLIPKGRNKTVFDELRFSYRFLQTLVDSRQSDPRRRLEKLTGYLVQAQIINVAGLLRGKSQTSPSERTSLPSSYTGGMVNGDTRYSKKGLKNANGQYCVDTGEVRDWVFNNFEAMGKIIVLEFGEGPFLSDGNSLPGPLSGELFAEPTVGSASPEPPAGLKRFPDGAVGALSCDGKITGPDGGLIATVTIGSTVVIGDSLNGGKTLNDAFPNYHFYIRSGQPAQKAVAWIQDGFLKIAAKVASGNSVLKPVDWVLNEHQGSGCDIDNVRLQHLDGTALEEEEWDKLHRFIRLWRKLGWTVMEVDRAIVELSNPTLGNQPYEGVAEITSDCTKETSLLGFNTRRISKDGLTGVTNGNNDVDDFLVTFDDYANSNSPNPPKIANGNTSSSGPNASWKPDITPFLIEQLSALVRTLPLVSISLEQLLCFWADIPTIAIATDASTTGTKPLYEKLFFTSNLKKNDPIFGPDANGNYFTGPEQKISDNLSVIMAAFKLEANDILFLLGETLDPFATANKIPIQDVLNIANLSQIYRNALLSRILGINLYDVHRALQGFGPAFRSATEFLEFIHWWDIMESLNFPWEELRYIVDEIETPNDPLMPCASSILGTAKTINDGIEEIKAKYVAPTDPDEAYLECTDEIVKSNLAIVFDDATAGQITGLLDGTIRFKATKVPKVPEIPDTTGLAFSEKVALVSSGKLTYSNPNDGIAQLLCRGILTADEMELAKELVDDIDEALATTSTTNGTVGAKVVNGTFVRKDKLSQTASDMKNMWLDALNSISIQPQNMFSDLFKGMFDADTVLSELNPQKTTILAGDVPENDTTASPDGKKPSQKRFYFLQLFVPYLQKTLARTLVIDAVISAVGFNDRTLAKTILENVKMDKESTQQKTIDYLLEILKPPNEDLNSFDGYITVPGNDSYAFLYPSESDISPPAITLDDTILNWSIYQENPKRYWTTDPTKASLISGKLYSASFKNIDLSILEWKPTSTHRSPVPPGSFMPQIALDKSLEVFDRLKKTAILVNHFKLSSDELIYIKEHKDDFDGMEFNSLSMAQWRRIQAYVAFRDSLPSTTSLPLIGLFNWSTQNGKTGGNDLVAQISKATNWKQGDVEAILTRVDFSNQTADDFKNEEVLLKCSKLIAMSGKLGVDIPRLFHWSVPLGTSSKDFFKLRDISEDIKKVARSKFDLSSWNDAVRPLNDILREQQNNALISYLLVQDEVRKQGVIDADSLFEFFLIDVQMTPPVETSRIKQAIATVQVFIQRCFLGLEKDIDPSQLDRTRWDWMSRYRVWEANRKVFLYPENWIDPTLRDDKSPFFLKLESELLQKDLTPDIITSALRNFLYSVNEVANMEITALCVEKIGPPVVSTKTTQSSWKLESTLTTTTTNPNATTTSTTETEGAGSPMTMTTTTTNTRIHLFARTSTSPFSYYYISYSMGNWTAWSKMDIEIPYYTTQDMAGKDLGVGTYMSPIVHAGRLIVFIPQIVKKSSANPNQIGRSSRTLAEHETDQLQAIEQWEIKMSFTELRDGRWMQRQMCPEGVLVENVPFFMDQKLTDGFYRIPRDGPIIRAIESFSFLTAEIIAPDPNFNSKDPSAPIPKVLLGVRVIASRFLPPPATTGPFPCDAPFVGIGEWDFVDGKLSFVGEGNQLGGSDRSRADLTAPAPIIYTPNALMEIINTNFEYQIGTTSKSTVLHSLTATDDRSGPLGPQLDSFVDAPKVAKGKIASSIDSKVSAEAKEVLIRKEADPSSGALVPKTQLLYHKFIHPLLVSASVEGTDDMPLISLYSYLSGLEEVISSTQSAVSAATDFKIDALTGGPINTNGFITDFVPPISDIDEAFGGIVTPGNNSTTGVFNERSTPFSIYNWELGLHAPMILIDRLLKMQQFEQALNVCHYVFNPLVQGNKTDLKKFWIFAPFKKVSTQTTEEMFLNFKAGQFRQDVADWRNNPFQPHVVARSRPQAYMMWIVMKYIEILIAYGDYYFRQNTLETIPDAIQMYILASHLYGPRGQKIPHQTPKKRYTYNDLATKFDAFSNVMVQLEEAFPYSNQTPLPVGKLPDDTSAPLANVFGFAGTLLFAIPDNPNLRALGDTIDDRLFKIRHSQDINGIFRQLPLFEPPIDPALLVQATAQGMSVDSVLQDLNGPMPNYRFQYLLSRALELAQEVKTFGSALLATREKIDFENMSLLRAKHDTITQTVLMDMKKLVLDEANKSLEALQSARNAPVSRLGFYLQQIGADLSGIPEIDKEFMELNAKIEKPISAGGLQLMASEKEEMDQYALSANLSTGVGILEIIGAGMNILPNFSAQYEPLGVGGTSTFGGSNIGAYYQAMARGAGMAVSDASYQAGVAGRKSQAMRALQDRILQANMAGYEIASIDKQVTANRIRIAMASKDIDIQQKQIDQMHEIEDFLRQKYSNKDLYSWMEGATRSLFYETYTQAYDLAKKAEKAFQFERPAMKSTSLIKNGYWDSTRDGLLAGEHLYNALKQLEAKYIEDRGYDYEITKNISLRQLDPMQLIKLRKTGICNFNVPEVLFDMDFPGHYMRRLKSVSISVPCIVGPYTSINSTLRLISHKIRFQSTKASGDSYAENISEPDERFTTSNVPITSIAVCNGQNDTGTFELNFYDDRYLPFEGAGAVSAWNFSLPQHIDSAFKQFNWESITDVIITLKYTSLDGGAQMMNGAQVAVKRYLQTVDYASTSGGLWGIFDLANEFSTAWARFLADQAATKSDSQPAAFDMPLINEKLPVFASCRAQGTVLANDVYILTDVAFPGSDLQLFVDGKKAGDAVLGSEKDVPDKMKCYCLSDGNGVVVGNWRLQLDSTSVGTPVGVKRAWLLFRYTLK